MSETKITQRKKQIDLRSPALLKNQLLFTVSLGIKMFPSRQQFKKWAYPSKFAFVSFFISIFLAIVFWIYPDYGKTLVSSTSAQQDQRVSVPGGNFYERQLALAMLEGALSQPSSSDFSIVFPLVQPGFIDQEPRQVVVFANSSPIQPTRQDVTFGPGRCKFYGIADLVLRNEKSSLTIDVHSLDCVLDNGDYYRKGFLSGDSRPIGYVVFASEPNNRWTKTSPVPGGDSFFSHQKYIARLFSPIESMEFVGKTSPHSCDLPPIGIPASFIKVLVG
jgi:hypothetical protein